MLLGRFFFVKYKNKILFSFKNYLLHISHVMNTSLSKQKNSFNLINLIINLIISIQNRTTELTHWNKNKSTLQKGEEFFWKHPLSMNAVCFISRTITFSGMWFYKLAFQARATYLCKRSKKACVWARKLQVRKNNNKNKNIIFTT